MLAANNADGHDQQTSTLIMVLGYPNEKGGLGSCPDETGKSIRL